MPRTVQITPHPFDVAVGQRVAWRRRELGLSQSDLGRSIGLTFQQIQKYERGANRISASRLSEIAKALGVSCAWLMGEDGAPSAEHLEGMTASTQKLVLAWSKLGGHEQKAVLELAQSLAAVKR